MYMQNFSGKNNYNEAKIFSANNFAGLNLGFISISDFEQKLKDKIMERYHKTGSLKYMDYYDIWILPDKYLSTIAIPQDIKSKSEEKQPSTSSEACSSKPISKHDFVLEALNLELTIRNLKAQNIIDNGITDYDNAIPRR